MGDGLRGLSLADFDKHINAIIANGRDETKETEFLLPEFQIH